MPKNSQANLPQVSQYDPRWFIWTIVFLLVSGIGLSAFITLSQNDAMNSVEFPKHITKR